MPESKKIPWKCPRWLLDVPIVKETLEHTLEKLFQRIRLFPGSNTEALLDEHKRANRNFIRQLQRELKNKDEDRRKELQRELSIAKAMHSSCPSDATSAKMDTEKAELL
ncbi:hypothetical protein PsorP6_004380 [Peronosclerospora sorghi]|uniref:Uncharacterized protein n=1 Tax=Peronosclerospora sorghi TaxID=230839 RepID=A0ACC0VLM5_9STRA|nr:hypothetical protein PsorP6_004380 [Peronosclerospora sorghi]